MDLALLWLGLIWSLFGGGRSTPAPAPPARPEPGPPAPWPAVVPSGLPPFPGSGWEYDEPPPLAVQMRARQLLSELWAKGQGNWRVEKTAGRWIVYRAEITRGNKRGVVAYREKRALPSSPASSTAARPAPTPAPAAPPAPVRPAPSPAPQVVIQPARVEPSVTPTGPLELPVLRYGVGLKPAPPDKDVRILQAKLGVAQDGRFGTDTRKAVEVFQASHNLKVDGIVGAKTWAALFATGRA